MFSFDIALLCNIFWEWESNEGSWSPPHIWPVCSFPVQLQIGSKPRATGDLIVCMCFSVFLCIYVAHVCLDCTSVHLTNRAWVKLWETGSGLCVAETVHRRARLAAPTPLSNPSNMTEAVPFLSSLLPLLYPLHPLLPNSQYPQQRLWDLKEKQLHSAAAADS